MRKRSQLRFLAEDGTGVINVVEVQCKLLVHQNISSRNIQQVYWQEMPSEGPLATPSIY